MDVDGRRPDGIRQDDALAADDEIAHNRSACVTRGESSLR
jgi:hypothetical protein